MLGTPPLTLKPSLGMWHLDGWESPSKEDLSELQGKIDPAPGKQTRCPSLRGGQNHHLQCLDTVSLSVICSSLFPQDLLLP